MLLCYSKYAGLVEVAKLLASGENTVLKERPGGTVNTLGWRSIINDEWEEKATEIAGDTDQDTQRALFQLCASCCSKPQ